MAFGLSRGFLNNLSRDYRECGKSFWQSQKLHSRSLVRALRSGVCQIVATSGTNNSSVPFWCDGRQRKSSDFEKDGSVGSGVAFRSAKSGSRMQWESHSAAVAFFAPSERRVRRFRPTNANADSSN